MKYNYLLVLSLNTMYLYEKFTDEVVHNIVRHNVEGNNNVVKVMRQG